MRFTSLLLTLFVVLVSSSSWASGHTLGPDFHPEILTDDSFDGTVFPNDKAVTAQRPFLLMFYAPWCGHCKHVLPIFNNASRVLYTTPGFKWATESARFGVIDATANPRLAQQFKVKSYPTFFYTLNGRAHRYGGAQTIQDFATNAVFLYQGFRLKSFADDITNYTDYRHVANAEVPRRPLFVVCSATRPAVEGPIPADHNTFIESILMQGKPRFALYVEDEGGFKASERPKMFKDIYHKQHWLIAEGCAEARAEKEKAEAEAATAEGGAATAVAAPKRHYGPNGESLLLWSDKAMRPIHYHGAWSGPAEEALSPYVSIKGSNPFRTARQAALWVWENSFNGVEKITTETLTGLSKRSKLGIFVVDGDLNFRTDKKYVPALQAMVQRRLAAFRKKHPHYATGIAAAALTDADGTLRIPRDWESPTFLNLIREAAPVSVGIADARIFGEWVKTLGYQLSDDGKGYPKFFVIDAMKDSIWRIEEWLPTIGKPANLLEAVGLEGVNMTAEGPEVAAISQFLSAIDAPEGSSGQLRGVPTTTTGLIARYITDYVPYSSKLSAMLGDDPILFLTVIGCFVMFIFVIIVSLRRGEEDEEAELNRLRAAKLERTRAAIVAKEKEKGEAAAASSTSSSASAVPKTSSVPSTKEAVSSKAAAAPKEGAADTEKKSE